jgi:hypothetical protein
MPTPSVIRSSHQQEDAWSSPVTDVNVDINDGTEWTEMDLRDLRSSLEHGDSIEKVTEFLCRQGTPDEVRRKAEELGLTYRTEPPRPPLRIRTITKADVVPFEGARFAVAYEFDDGKRLTVPYASGEEAALGGKKQHRRRDAGD